MIAHGPKRRAQTLYQLLKHVFTRAKRVCIYAPRNAPSRHAKELPRHNFSIVECAFASPAEKHFIINIEKMCSLSNSTPKTLQSTGSQATRDFSTA